MPFPSSIDLGALGGSGIKLTSGEGDADQAGRSVAVVGDVNNDSIDDFVVGIPASDPNGDSSGTAYLVFGKAGLGALTLSPGMAAADGIRLVGAGPGDDFAGASVEGVGDVNDDGIDDFAVAASNSDGARGAVYVIYGKEAGWGNITLSSGIAAADGFKVTGQAVADTLNRVSAAGDVNDDGIADYMVASQQNNGQTGAVYVLFGKSSGLGPIDLASLNAADGFRIQGEAAGNFLGGSISSIGDFNNDGVDDILIGAAGNNSVSGAAYVIFGKTTIGSSAINLATLAADGNGFKIGGAGASARLGHSVGSAGDFNNDGVADLVVGQSDGGFAPGAAYVIMGKSGATTVNLGALASTDGFKITGFDVITAGHDVASAGDVDGDGFDDVIIAAKDFDTATEYSGATYVIYGKGGPTFNAINLATLAASDGFGIFGESDYDYAGYSVDGGGDVNGDGAPDIIIGAISADSGGDGAAYIVFGLSSNTAPTQGANAGLTVNEGAAGTITTTQLDFNDAEQADGAITYTVTSAATNGTLSRLGVTLALNDTFTQDDINNNRIAYTHNGGETTTAGFGFSVSDGQGGSVAGQTFGFTITPQNDAPTGPGLPASQAFTEDSTTEELDISALTIADPDSNSLTLTLGLNSGRFDLAASSDVTVSGHATSTATITGPATNINLWLDTLSNTWFVPAANFDGTATLTVTINDNDGSGDVSLGTMQLNVTGSQDAPTLSGGPFALTGTDEDTASSATLVSAILGGVAYGDVDTGALSGIAITAAGGNGTWQYSTDGAAWTAVGTVSGNAALLLSSTTQIRYVPDGVAGETPALTFRAWDQTSGTPSSNGLRSTADTSTNGNATAFSSGTAQATMTVSSIEDPAVAVDDTFFTNEATAIGAGLNLFSVNPNTADSDPDGPALDVTHVDGQALAAGTIALTLASGALLTVNDDGTFSYNPNGAFERSPDASSSNASNATVPDTFTYTITGGDTATVTVVVDGLDNTDFLLGSAAGDLLFGGLLNDTIEGGLGNDALDGGTGRDIASYGNSAGGVLADLTGAGVGFDADGDSYVLIEGVNGSRFSDTLRGGAGDDVLNGYKGGDEMEGRGGNDVYTVDHAGDVVIEASLGGFDTVRSTVTVSTLSANVEKLVLAGTADLDATANGDGNDVVGNSGANEILGLGGNDMLHGAGGADTLSGGDNADQLYGEAGADLIDGGADNDTGHGGDGIDTLNGGAGIDRLNGNADADTLNGDGEADSLLGGAGGDTLNGGNDNDRLLGEADGDTLNGDAGVDRLYGDAGDDALAGGAGKDSLYGGAGQDTLTGGTEADRFIFEAVADLGTAVLATDRIVDFNQGAGETIVFNALDADGDGGNGDTAFSFLATQGAAFTNVAGQLRFAFGVDGADAFTGVEGDTDGDGTADFALRLDGHIDLVAKDFYL